MQRVVGIDLGTTNSVVATLEGGGPVVIPNAEGARTTPSVVAFAKDGATLVGEVAKRQAVTNAARTIRSAKRHMGTEWSHDVDGHAWSAPEVAARVLQKLKADAEAFLGGTVTQAVVTVPAYFDDAARTATKQAGEIAGLEVLRIINEPTAAALAYGLGDAEEQTVVVFDLGGGTFDVSVLSLGDGVFEVLATGGDARLGGDDWDQAVIDWLVEEFRAAHGVDLSVDKMAAQRLKEAAEKAKIELSQVAQTQINLPFITATDHGPLHLEANLTRSHFEALTEPLLERCRAPFEGVLNDAGLETGAVDHVVLVGGSTRMPAVRDLVESLAGRTPHQGVSADEVVALGAAVQAGVLTGAVSDVLLLDVCPLSLGIETEGGVMTTLVERNTTIPTKKTELFTTASDDQRSVEVHVLQGERTMAADNTTLGRFSLGDLPPAPRGVPQIEVSFDIDANGIVSVSAKDRATGKEQSVTITGRSSLSESDIAAAVDAAASHAATDQARRELAEATNRAGAAVYAARRLAGSDTTVPADRSGLEAHAAELEATVAHSDRTAILASTDTLERLVAEVSARAARDNGTGTPGRDGGVDAEVIDAEIVDAEIVDG